MADPPTGPGGDITTNDEFDRRISSIPNYGNGSGLIRTFRGYLQTAYPTAGDASVYGKQYTLTFLYNPSAISVSHSISSANQVMPAFTRVDTGTPLVAAGGTLTWSLLFDRTYELTDQTQSSSLAGSWGVAADVHVLYNMVGMNRPITTIGPEESGRSILPGAAGQTEVTGVMQMNYIKAVFGAAKTGYAGTLPGISRLRYFGYITSISVTYTHFTQNMVASRCAVGVTMQLLAPSGWSIE